MNNKFKELLKSTYEEPASNMPNSGNLANERYFLTPSKRIVGGIIEGGQLCDARVINEPAYSSIGQLNALNREVLALKAGKLALQPIAEIDYPKYGITAGLVSRKPHLTTRTKKISGGATERTVETDEQIAAGGDIGDGTLICDFIDAGAKANGKGKAKPKAKAKGKVSKGKGAIPDALDFDFGGGALEPAEQPTTDVAAGAIDLVNPTSNSGNPIINAANAANASKSTNDTKVITLGQVLKAITSKAMREAQDMIEGGVDPVTAYNPDAPIFGGKIRKAKHTKH